MRFEMLKARKMSGYTQQQLADIIGVSQDIISRIERGKQVEIDVMLANNIASALNCDMKQIFLSDDEYKLRKEVCTHDGSRSCQP